MAKTKKNKSQISEGDPQEPEKAPDEGSSIPPPEPALWVEWLRERISTPKIATIVVLVLGALLFLPRLGTLGLWDPWETHYGEVAREMIVRDDYVYPHWESAYFFSKPALALWMAALGMLVVGAESGAPGEPLGSLTEWGVRFPFALVAMFTLWAVYRIGTQLKDRIAGVVSAAVLASCAQFIFIGKQSMVDMPLVGFMTIGLAFFVGAVFNKEDDHPADTRMKAVTGGAIVLTVFTQLFLIGREMDTAMEMLPLIGAALLAAGFIVAIALKGTRNDCYLAAFYICIGLAALAKGLAVLAMVGPLVILYMFVTLDFHILKRSKVLLGGVLFLLVAAPWYVTVSLFKLRDDEGKTFVQRFWLHDNLSRVGRGVHGDRAGMGYYIEQLAYGMFPWCALIPYALGFAARKPEDEEAVMHRRLVLFVLIWGLWGYAFFTMSQTKFHHYIFPAVPALAILVGYWFSWVADDPGKRLNGYMPVIIAMLFAVVARDLINKPQHLVSLFTYKYDREYPRDLNPWPFIIAIISVGSLAMIFFYARRQKGHAMLSFGAMALVFGFWISHYHFNMLSPHWSQYYLWDTYHSEKVGDEPIYAYQLNWRGETFYSRNRILQVKEAGANQRMRALVDRPGREFIITEQSRFHTLRNVLSPDKRDKIRIIDRSNNHFYLCVVED